MDDKDTMQQEDIEIEAGENTAEEADAADDTGEDEFEYDEEGNIIIPEVVDDDFAQEIAAEDAEEDAGTDEEEESTEAETEEAGDPAKTLEVEREEEAQEKPDPSAGEIAKLREELRLIRSQAKDTLEKLGVREDDPLKGLASVAAEAEGISTEDYLDKQAKERLNERARAILQQQEFEKLARADLAELQATYPETLQYKDIRDLPDDIRREFGKYRGLGLSAKKAYAAANPDGIRSRVAAATRQQALHAAKDHLRTNVPKGSKDESVTMTRAEILEWRGLFPGKSDREIRKLYKETASN